MSISSGDPRFQFLPFADREIIIPSGNVVAMGLEDYRHLYRTYKSAPFLQKTMENHTWIVTRDDHENDTLGAPDHPYTVDGFDAEALFGLMLD